jgi:hypothetical protein
VTIDEYVEQVVADAPALSQAQIDRLRLLLHGTSRPAAGGTTSAA